VYEVDELPGAEEVSVHVQTLSFLHEAKEATATIEINNIFFI
jgi:hypothetical protein